VQRWVQRYGFADEVEFVEDIPYTETRNYVKRVLVTTIGTRRCTARPEPRKAGARLGAGPSGPIETTRSPDLEGVETCGGRDAHGAHHRRVGFRRGRRHTGRPENLHRLPRVRADGHHGPTAQNTRGVRGVELPTTDFIAAQLRAVLEDIGADAVKTGMLATGPIIRTVAGVVREFRLNNVVVDPVMIAASGDALMQNEAAPVMREHLFPLATVVTPNLDEATVLCERKIRTTDDMEEARGPSTHGPRYVWSRRAPGGRSGGGPALRRPRNRAAGKLRIPGSFTARAAPVLGHRIRPGQRLTVPAAVATAQAYIRLAMHSAPASAAVVAP